MNGLILKDIYMIGKYCKYYLLVAFIFIAASFVSIDNMFFVFYPCLLCGMIPVTLLGYDERSRWMQYSGVLPYTKEQIVSSKYVIGIFVEAAVIFAIAVTQAIRMNMSGTFVLKEYVMIILVVFIMSTFASSISLPFIFKSGVEKGRISYYVMIAVVCTGGFFASNMFSTGLHTDISLDMILIALGVIVIGVYAFSWHMSIVFFKKREI